MEEKKEDKIIDGKKVAGEIREELKKEVPELIQRVGRPPGLAVILVGENPASQVYVRTKKKGCEELEIFSLEHRLPEQTKEEELLSLIEELNQDERIDGILVQLPLPDHLNEGKVLNAIDPDKDVDGFHPVNVGRMVVGEKGFLPCTPAGIQQLLIRSGVEIRGANVVVVGRSNIVGKPVANILIQKKDGADATVTVCHSRTRDLPAVTRQADILIAAMGRAKFITPDMVKDGAVVIDVGVNRVDDPSAKKGYRLVGDVDFDGVFPKVRAITPVPGGVGPMTVIMLLRNTVESFKRRMGVE